MSRANTHSAGCCQSGGSGKSPYSRPGYCRKGCWKAHRPARNTIPHPTVRSTLREIIRAFLRTLSAMMTRSRAGVLIESGLRNVRLHPLHGSRVNTVRRTFTVCVRACDASNRDGRASLQWENGQVAFLDQAPKSPDLASPVG